jgi:hypothetical protein
MEGRSPYRERVRSLLRSYTSGAMQDYGCGLRRRPLLGSRVNKGGFSSVWQKRARLRQATQPSSL